MSDHTDWSSDDLDDREYPDEDTADDEDELDTVECPECHRQVYEEAEQCPHCGHFITHDTHVWAGKPLWWIALALLGTVAVIWALLGIGW